MFGCQGDIRFSNLVCLNERFRLQVSHGDPIIQRGASKAVRIERSVLQTNHVEMLTIVICPAE